MHAGASHLHTKPGLWYSRRHLRERPWLRSSKVSGGLEVPCSLVFLGGRGTLKTYKDLETELYEQNLMFFFNLLAYRTSLKLLHDHTGTWLVAMQPLKTFINDEYYMDD